MSKRKKQEKHWKKEESERNENKILTLLRNSDMRFSELQQELSEISPTTLDKHLKTLLKKNLISRYWNEDKKARYYQITLESKDQVQTQLSKYEAIKFIKEIPRMTHYSPQPKGKINLAVFTSVPATQPRKEWIEEWQQKISTATKLLKISRIERLLSNRKTAIVIMYEGEDGS
jgi:DNA-binding MarR family transcriptional regulator